MLTGCGGIGKRVRWARVGDPEASLFGPEGEPEKAVGQARIDNPTKIRSSDIANKSRQAEDRIIDTKSPLLREEYAE